MPGRSLGPTTDTVPTIKFGSLKGHKSLPRGNHVAAETHHRRSSEERHGLRSTSDQTAYTSADRIKSWIPDPSPIRVMPVVGAPLTPPINFRDDFQSWIDDAALRKREFGKRDKSPTPGTTPLVQQSPPTPEASPPKKIQTSQAVASFYSSRNATESGAESFKTAHENQSSDDEGQSSDSPSLHPSRQKWLKTLELPKHGIVGLGLGLESEDEEPTPREIRPERFRRPQDFITTDGAWSDVKDNVKITEVLEDSMKPTSHKGRSKHARIVSEPVLDSPTLGKGPDESLKKSLSLRERVERTRHSPRKTSIEKFAEQIEWPLKDYIRGDIDTELREMNDQRLSQASTTSTVVEAMVVNSPPRRRQTLRRTIRMTDLNTPHPNSAPNLSTKNDTPARRRLRRSGSPDQELRKSFASGSPDSVAPREGKHRQDTAPVVPDRGSSLQSSASGSKHLSRTCSLTSRQQSSRPTTAPEESVGYFDIPRPRDRRTMSVIIHAPTPLKPEPKLLSENSASVTAAASPPSVPTSSTEEPSKSTSVTSAGVDASYAPPTPNFQPSVMLNTSDAQNPQPSSMDRHGPGDWTATRPRSTQVTPFSLRSAHSSTPGTLEINEATAISIYPHTNQSILVIQQTATGGDSSPMERSRIIAGNANISLPGPVTPVIQHEAPPQIPRETLDSPLRHPRDPPQPPDFKIIPPTPANGSGSLEKGRSPPRTPTKRKRFSAPVSTFKRAFSARRPRSESHGAPFSRTFSLRGTADDLRRRSQLDDERQSKLHPFWRPRSYDNGSDSDSEFGNTGFLNASRVQTQSSRDGPPHRTMSLTRRLSNSIRLPHPVRKPRPSSMVLTSDQHHYESRRPDGSGYEGESGGRVPGQGPQVQFVGFRRLADKLERRREAREEGKREERRQSLRGKIGLVRNGSMGQSMVQGNGI